MSLRLSWRIAWLLTVLLFPLQSLARNEPQDRPPVFRVEVNVLAVDVIVTDADGAFVRGLDVEDFELFENGEARDIHTFALVDLPGPSAEANDDGLGESHYGVATNDDLELGRLYVLVLDDLHVRPQRTARVQALARRFIRESLAPGDLVAVAYTSGRARGFTANHVSLLRSVDGVHGKDGGLVDRRPPGRTGASPGGR